jgi:peroxiredoxin
MSAPDMSSNLLANTSTSTGESLAALSEISPVLLVLLRHEGCPFCRNAMSDMARLRDRIEDAGTRIVLGHMGSAEDFAVFAARYGLSSLAHVTDPGRTLYKGLGLRRGTVLQMLGPRLWCNWFKAVLRGHLAGRIKGDVFQLPGAFLLHRGKVVKSHAYRDASDRPDYLSLATL